MSNNVLQAKVTIVGTRPLFWHKFGPDALPLEKQERTGVAGNDPEEWRRTVLATKDGQLFVYPTYVFGAIIGGARNIKKGRGSIQPAVKSTLQIMDEQILIDRWFAGFPNGKAFDVKTARVPAEDPEQSLYLDIRGVVNPSTKARNVRYRVVASPGWTCSFTIVFDKTIVSRNEMESAVIDAGKFVGIGNARAIGMGRFDVASFEVQE